MLTPRWQRPVHLSTVAALIERAATEEVRALVSVPRQHGKTELVKAGLVWLMQCDPTRDHAYVSYEAGRGHEIGQKVQRLARLAGMQPEGARDRWALPQGGTLYSTGIGGPLTGRGISGLLVVDDPHKNREEANSPILREKVYDWWTSVAISGVRPGGSAIVVHTRWHEEDLIGRLVAAKLGWLYVNLPAITDAGEALWPEAWPLEFLERRRADMGEFDWWALMMGQPRPIGSAVFRDVQFYDKLPDKYRVGIGFDLAVTAKTSSDYCAAVVLAEADDNYYVLDVRREQSTLPKFAGQLRVLKESYPGARMLWYASTTEMGTADLLREESGLPVYGELAKAEKFVRAQPVAAAWNGVPGKRAGRVFVPRSAPWLSAFVGEVCGFTGLGDRHDDQVDALAAAFDVLERGRGLQPVTTIRSKFEPSGATIGSRFQW